MARWSQLLQDLQSQLPLNPRCVIPRDERSAEYELCVSGDASKRLYASCVYLLCRSSSSIVVHLLMAKSLLGPRKNITMPRMELLAVLVSLRLVQFVHTHLHINVKAIRVFSESQIVLHWIHSTRCLRTLVRNRITEICTIVGRFRSANVTVQFCHVSSENNCASRGISTSIAENHIWWSGPSLLRTPPAQWPGNNDFTLLPVNDNEVHNEYQTLSVSEIPPYTSPIRFRCVSRYKRLVRSTAYLLKFYGSTIYRYRSK
ncbi:hypothetical protein GCK32_001204 [Trichostrongylus colubriformis]|uniref:Uncharacterized protein n=1 Tax=Trichostrongylus colubriformis TaxID=6319 RepID=A0AAN8FLU0_TRICO